MLMSDRDFSRLGLDTIHRSRRTAAIEWDFGSVVSSKFDEAGRFLRSESAQRMATQGQL